MFGFTAICWDTWICRNKACFKNRIIKNPCEILFSACAFMCYLAGLYPEAQKLIKAGVEVMMQMTLKLLGKEEAGHSQQALQGADTEDEDDHVGGP
jgi:hypothetical protein